MLDPDIEEKEQSKSESVISFTESVEEEDKLKLTMEVVMEELKEGDVVQLKSGVPKMTVVQVYRGREDKIFAICDWFIENKRQQDTFK